MIQRKPASARTDAAPSNRNGGPPASRYESTAARRHASFVASGPPANEIARAANGRRSRTFTKVDGPHPTTTPPECVSESVHRTERCPPISTHSSRPASHSNALSNRPRPRRPSCCSAADVPRHPNVDLTAGTRSSRIGTNRSGAVSKLTQGRCMPQAAPRLHVPVTRTPLARSRTRGRARLQASRSGEYAGDPARSDEPTGVSACRDRPDGPLTDRGTTACWRAVEPLSVQPPHGGSRARRSFRAGCRGLRLRWCRRR